MTEWIFMHEMVCNYGSKLASQYVGLFEGTVWSIYGLITSAKKNNFIQLINNHVHSGVWKKFHN